MEMNEGGTKCSCLQLLQQLRLQQPHSIHIHTQPQPTVPQSAQRGIPPLVRWLLGAQSVKPRLRTPRATNPQRIRALFLFPEEGLQINIEYVPNTYQKTTTQ